MTAGSDIRSGAHGAQQLCPGVPHDGRPLLHWPWSNDRWAVVQLAARQVLALVVLVRVQAAQLLFTASHLQLHIRDASGGTTGGTICALRHAVASVTRGGMAVAIDSRPSRLSLRMFETTIGNVVFDALFVGEEE
jgi:hypothetical protein